MNMTPPSNDRTTAARARISELAGNFQFCQKGLLEVASLLPKGDDELHRWLEQAVASQAENEFDFMIFAAAMAGRKLQASLLPAGMYLLPDAQRLAWIAWHMEGEVGPALLQAVDAGGIPVIHSTIALFVAAAWWRKHRPEEALPQKIAASVELSVRHLPEDPTVLTYLAALIDLMTDPAVGSSWKLPRVRGAAGKKLKNMKRSGKAWRREMMRKLERPFSRYIPKRLTRYYISWSPFRRPLPKVGRNDDCRCGSEKKYKDCCEQQDKVEMQRLSHTAGKSPEEAARSLNAHLTRQRLEELRPVELLHLDPLLVPPDLQTEYLMRLAAFKRFEALADAFDKLGVPEALEEGWKAAIFFAARAGRPDILERLVKVAPTEDLPAFCQLSRAAHDPAVLVGTLEQASRQALEDGSVDAIRDIALGLLFSPAYRALGILVARGTLPLMSREQGKQAYDDILTARGELDLSPDDEFADFVEQRGAREQDPSSNADLLVKQAEQEAKAAENRRLKEEKANLQRALKLSLRREREAAEFAGIEVPAGPSEETRMLQTQLKNVEAMMRDLGAERIALRHEIAELEAEVARLRLAQGLTEDGEAESNEEEPGEEVNITGQQPVRLLRFAEKFSRSLDRLPRQTGAAVMSHLGRLAAGDANEMSGRKKIYELDGVKRTRVGDYRVLFRFTPKDVEVVDVVDRRDLQKRLKALRNFGLPAMATSHRSPE